MTDTTIKIVSRWDSSKVLFEHKATLERQASGFALRDAQDTGLVAAVSAHPITLYFLSGVPQQQRELTFAGRRPLEQRRRAEAVRQGRHGPTYARRAAELPPARRGKAPVKAVDPHALRADAKVTGLDTVQVQLCAGYRTRWERMAAEAKPARLPQEPASGWVAAMLAQRDKEPMA